MLISFADLESKKIKLNFGKGFLVLDGPNGAGKSTLQIKIINYLNQIGKKTVSTREPGGTNFGQTIRSLILGQKSEEPLDPWTEVYLFSADRKEHLQKKIIPALSANNIVVCDRFYYSTIAFQGYGRGLNLNDINTINHQVVRDCLPDLVLLLDLDPKLGLERTQKRSAENNSAEIDAFEREALEFHTKLRNGFINIAQNCEEPCVLIDASESADQVWEKTKKILDCWMENLK
jgi:dTMP kinase